jgi:hypothetical protein
MSKNRNANAKQFVLIGLIEGHLKNTPAFKNSFVMWPTQK